jgi:hypothetical protein
MEINLEVGDRQMTPKPPKSNRATKINLIHRLTQTTEGDAS